MRHVSDHERRARLGLRHALAPASRLGSVEAVVEALAALHATEPATVYLSCHARGDGLGVAEVDRALYVDRSVVKQLAMRRTLFVVTRGMLPAVLPSASARVAATERARLAKDAVAAGLSEDGDRWVARACDAVHACLLEHPDGLQAAEVRGRVPMVDVRLGDAPAAPWSVSRVLTVLAASGAIVRGANAGGWHTSRPRWTTTSHWIGEVPPVFDAAGGYWELVHAWLRTFGPGTEDDIVWWLGSTRSVVRTALAELGAETVALDDGTTGWLLAEDLEMVERPDHWAALLPVLDPSVMGWKGRDFYLGPHRSQLFDTNGNAGTTAWVDGRVVGAWVQDDDAVVEVRMLEPVSASERQALDAEAERLTAWLDGRRIGSVYSSPVMR